MPLHWLPIYSNLAEKRPVIVSASLSSACLPTSLGILRCRRRLFLRLFHSSSLVYALISFPYTSFPSQSRFSSEKRGGSHSCVDGRCGQDAATKEKGSKPRVTKERERGKLRIRLALRRERRTTRENRTSEESVMRSLNTDAGKVKYIVEKGETKKEEPEEGWDRMVQWIGWKRIPRKELAIALSHGDSFLGIFSFSHTFDNLVYLRVSSEH